MIFYFILWCSHSLSPVCSNTNWVVVQTRLLEMKFADSRSIFSLLFYCKLVLVPFLYFWYIHWTSRVLILRAWANHKAPLDEYDFLWSLAGLHSFPLTFHWYMNEYIDISLCHHRREYSNIFVNLLGFVVRQSHLCLRLCSMRRYKHYQHIL